MRKITGGFTPADVARVTLDNIGEDHPSLNMRSWIGNAHQLGIALQGDSKPSECGTTLCVAGWVAFSLGWCILPGGHATRDGGESHVSEIAQTALGLSNSECDVLWYASEEEAVDQLRYIADGKRIKIGEDPVGDEF
jgi:hypothetical protein